MSKTKANVLMINKPKKIPKPKSIPIRLEVGFPMDSRYENRSFKQSKLNRLLNRLKKMSDDEFSFTFDTGVIGSFRIIPE